MNGENFQLEPRSTFGVAEMDVVAPTRNRPFSGPAGISREAPGVAQTAEMAADGIGITAISGVDASSAAVSGFSAKAPAGSVASASTMARIRREGINDSL